MSFSNLLQASINEDQNQGDDVESSYELSKGEVPRLEKCNPPVALDDSGYYTSSEDDAQDEAVDSWKHMVENGPLSKLLVVSQDYTAKHCSELSLRTGR
jgi:hypothetical protein